MGFSFNCDSIVCLAYIIIAFAILIWPVSLAAAVGLYLGLVYRLKYLTAACISYAIIVAASFGLVYYVECF